MRNARITAILIVIFAIMWIGGNILMHGNQSDEVEATVADKPTVEDPVVIISKSTAVDKYKNLRLFGQTIANRDITIIAKTSGDVKEILFERGQYVNAGDVLLRLSQDNRPLELKQAEANLKEAQAEFNSVQELVKQKYRSTNELVAAEAKVAIAEASLEKIKLDISYTEIKAPFSGYTGTNLVDLGSYVSAGTNITKLLELNPLKVVVHVSENTIADIDRAGKAFVTIHGEQADAKIANTSYQADENTRTFAVDVVLDNKDGRFSAGQTAIVQLPIQKVKAHLISPAYIGLNSEGQFGIKTVNDKNIIEFYKADLVDDSTEGMWVSGLPDEVNIITQGTATAEVGKKVSAFYSQEEAHLSSLEAEAQAQANRTADVLLKEAEDNKKQAQTRLKEAEETLKMAEEHEKTTKKNLGILAEPAKRAQKSIDDLKAAEDEATQAHRALVDAQKIAEDAELALQKAKLANEALAEQVKAKGE
ncbi:MAG: efflux RND transporter periplasmic adaptor subunit [Alphaproteobacteria bacterium]